jgi:dihydropteroate synthase
MGTRDRLLRRMAQQGPLVCGIVNATPDSFSDGGRYVDPAAAIDDGLALIAQGADMLDIGGESTRPGARPPSVAAEIARVVPVVDARVRRRSRFRSTPRALP